MTETVEGTPVTVARLIVIGKTSTFVVPSLVVVVVVVVTDRDKTVVVACALPVVELPPIVTVVVTWLSRLLAILCAFRIAVEGIGAPASLQAICSGLSKRETSERTLSEHCQRMQVTRLGRKFPDEARQKQAMSVAEQFSSSEELMHCCMHCGRSETESCAFAEGSRAIERNRMIC